MPKALEPGGHVGICIAVANTCIRDLQVVYFQADGYPASPAMLMCDDDQELNGQLHGLNDHFEEYAVLSDVLRAVCIALKFGERRLLITQTTSDFLT